MSSTRTPTGPSLLFSLVPLSAALMCFLHGPWRLFGLLPLAVFGVLARQGRAACPGCAVAMKINEERLQELAKLQEALAHELRNPLASIKGLAALVVLEPARAEERVEVLRNVIRDMEKTLDNHLCAGRPLSPLHAREVRLGAVVADVVDMHDELAAKRNIRLHMRLEENDAVRCDPEKLSQALISVLHNAIEASPTDEAVEVAVERDVNVLRVSVSDRGPGIDEPDLERASLPEFSTQGGALGVGLMMSRAFVEQHGGTLGFKNRAGGGVEVRIELPL